MMTAEEVRKRIEELSEPSYQQFSARLIPNVKSRADSRCETSASQETCKRDRKGRLESVFGREI